MSRPCIQAVVFLPYVRPLNVSDIILIFMYALFILLLLVSTIMWHLYSFNVTVYVVHLYSSYYFTLTHNQYLLLIFSIRPALSYLIYIINACHALALIVVYIQYVPGSSLI
jgi:hypothetical protein